MPYDLKFDAPRVVAYDEEDSHDALEDGVDTLDEARDVALARTTTYQQSLRNYHSRRLRPRSFLSWRLGPSAEAEESSQARVPLGRTLRIQRSSAAEHTD